MNKIIKDCVSHSFATWGVSDQWNPIEVISAQGVYFKDSNEKNILDFSSQLLCVNLGHDNTEIRKGIDDYLQKSSFVNPLFTTKIKSEVLNQLYDLFDGAFDKFFLPSSGTAANEAAIKMARLYTGKNKIISRQRSYHGATSLSLMMSGDARRDYFNYPVEEVLFVSNFNNVELSTEERLEELEQMVEQDNDIACFVLEPVACGNGVLIPDEAYIVGIREICTKNEIVLIFDEVASGWGRTGELFAYQNWGVVPDMLTSAKGMTNAILPLGLTAVSKEIADFFNDKYFPIGHTYESHPVALAAAKAAISQYVKIDYDEVKKKGEFLLRKLEELKEKFALITAVRGIGLLCAVEFSSDIDAIDVQHLTKNLLENGLLVYGAKHHIVVAPPLIITTNEIEDGIEIMNEILKEYV